ncbi:hypothetical protein EG329_013710 [Mollisiaceae sp. DMI_Dod_QoI]|nr:hypothetical protein EG329_013710 [Helotiales sp. DMI_Dod_QoI]
MSIFEDFSLMDAVYEDGTLSTSSTLIARPTSPSVGCLHVWQNLGWDRPRKQLGLDKRMGNCHNQIERGRPCTGHPFGRPAGTTPRWWRIEMVARFVRDREGPPRQGDEELTAGLLIGAGRSRVVARLQDAGLHVATLANHKTTGRVRLMRRGTVPRVDGEASDATGSTTIGTGSSEERQWNVGCSRSLPGPVAAAARSTD